MNNADQKRDRENLLTALLGGQSPDVASKRHMADELIKANIALRNAYKELYFYCPDNALFSDGIVGDLPEVRAARMKSAPWWKRALYRVLVFLSPEI
ncbi:hypothetical protein KJ865_12995 [Myxococcota bacterium]|nr:hypothetical protein [Myxococcota bacterium]